MLRPHHSPCGLALPKSLMPCSHGHANFLLPNLCSSSPQKSRSCRRRGFGFSSTPISSNNNIRAEAVVSSNTAGEPTVSAVKVVVTVKLTAGGLLSNLSLTAPLDAFTDLIGKSLLLELVSAELDASK